MNRWIWLFEVFNSQYQMVCSWHFFCGSCHNSPIWHVSSVQNPSIIPLYWLVYRNSPIIIPNILGSIIPELIINQQGFWTLLTWELGWNGSNLILRVIHCHHLPDLRSWAPWQPHSYVSLPEGRSHSYTLSIIVPYQCQLQNLALHSHRLFH